MTQYATDPARHALIADTLSRRVALMMGLHGARSFEKLVRQLDKTRDGAVNDLRALQDAGATDLEAILYAENYADELIRQVAQ